MMSNTLCPCCKQKLPDSKRILFFDAERVVSRKGKQAQLTPMQFRILKLLDKSSYDSSVLVDRLYGNDEDGGPDTPSHKMIISQMRKKLEPLGLFIKCSGNGGRGKDGTYSLIRT